MSRLLRRSAWRQALRHPWQTVLTLIGISVAVAVVAGIDLAHEGSLRAFKLSVEGVSGKADYEIVAGSEGFPFEVYVDLRRSGAPWAHRLLPVIEGRGHLRFVSSDGVPGDGVPGDGGPGDGGPEGASADVAVRLLGIDPFAEQGARPFLRRIDAGWDGTGIQSFLTDPDTVSLGRPLAALLGISDDGPSPEAVLRWSRTRSGEDSGENGIELRIHSVLLPTSGVEAQALEDLVVCDLATAQELLDRPASLDRIDLELGENAERWAESLRQALPPGLELRSKASSSAALADMTRAFRLNLHALSLLALLVGVFLVYNTLNFSVLQQRAVFGRLRAMGVRRAEIFRMVLAEALLLGIAGTVIGTLLGLLTADHLLALVTRTINDLYFAVQVQSVTLTAPSLIKIAALGLLGPLLAAAGPAWEACQSPPSEVMRRSSSERRLQGRSRTRRRLAFVALVGALALLAVPSRSVPLAFGAVFIFVLGFSLLVPDAVALASRGIAALGRGRRRILTRLAVRDVEASLSRTGVAAAALTLALATSLGVGIMVHSFRGTLEVWLGGVLQADLYVSSEFQDARGRGPLLEPDSIEKLSSDPAVEAVSTYRRVEVPSSRGPTQLHALGIERRDFESFQFSSGDRDRIWPGFRAGEGVLVSESYSRHQELAPGDRLELAGPGGSVDLPVLGIYYDYASDRGIVAMHQERYRAIWQDDGINSLGLYLTADVAADAAARDSVLRRLRQEVAGEDVRLLSNLDLRRASLAIFDRTFKITAVLRILALGVALFGLLSALMALQMEKGRFFGVLAALGAVPKQVFRLILLQTSLLGAFAGVAALPLGTALSAMLIYVINKRSFGWTLNMTVTPQLLWETLVLALVAGCVAGLYPAWKMSRHDVSRALREE